MTSAEDGFFVEFPDQKLFRVSAVEGTTLFVTPCTEADRPLAGASSPAGESPQHARLHVVSKDITCSLDTMCTLTGTKLAFTGQDTRLQQLIAQQYLKDTISVPAFLEFLKQKSLDGVGGDAGAQKPFYAAGALNAKPRQPMHKAFAYAATLVLAVVFGSLWLQQSVTIADTASLVSSDYRLVESPVTGTVIFVHDSRSITAGEPIFGIESTSGRPVVVNAPVDTAGFEATVTPGMRIQRGRTLGRIADGSSIPQLIAYVPFSEALEIAKGAVAQVTFRDGSVSYVPIDREDIRYSVRNQDTRNPLMKIRFALSDDYRPLVGQSASITIRRENRIYRELCNVAGSVPPAASWCGPAAEKAT